MISLLQTIDQQNRSENAKISYTNTEKAKEIVEQLEKHFPNEGKKVLNLMNSLYFEEMVIPMISALKQRFGDEDYKERFRAFYSDLLKFFPIAVFAGNNSNTESLKRDITLRLGMKNIPFVRIHGIGASNIEKIEQAIRELGIDTKYTTQSERIVAPSGLDQLTYTIRL